MISAHEALAIAESRKVTPEGPVDLTDDELVSFNYIDYTLETAIHATFNGGVFVLPVPAHIAGSLNVIKAIKRRYEEGEWLVGVQPVRDGDKVSVFNMMFAPKQFGVVKQAADALPTVIPVTIGTLTEGTARVLVRMPSRARWAKAIDVLAKYRAFAGMSIAVEVVVDHDDETLTSEVLYRLSALACTVTYGWHRSKVEACNGGARRDWDILVLASDDMVPVKDGWARRVVELFAEHWPHFDGALHLNDGYAGQKLCTLPIMGRRLHEQFIGAKTPLLQSMTTVSYTEWNPPQAYVYHPDYKSLWCDNEYTEVLQAMGRLPYIDETLIEHHHPASGKSRVDALYARNDALWKEDEATCIRRRDVRQNGAAWGFDSPPMLLSILVATYPARKEMLARLLDHLYAQMALRCRNVEVIIDDKPAPSLGEKRQRLLDRAKGHFIAFVDDDDWVSSDYVQRICDTIEDNPLADCLSLVGVLTTNGSRPERFEHSLSHEAWQTRTDGVHVRYPNHLNPVRTAIAREVGFTDLTYTEDKEYSDRLRPRLHVEASTGDKPLYHYWFRSKEQPAGAVK